MTTETGGRQIRIETFEVPHVGTPVLVVDGLAERTVLIGQAVYTQAEWDGTTDPAVSGVASAWDRAAYGSSVALLRALQPDVVLFGHDR